MINKRMQSYRLEEETIQGIKELSNYYQITQSELIERLVRLEQVSIKNGECNYDAINKWRFLLRLDKLKKGTN